MSVQEISGKHHSAAFPGPAGPNPAAVFTLASELREIMGFRRSCYTQPQAALVLVVLGAVRCGDPGQAPHGPRPGP